MGGRGLLRTGWLLTGRAGGTILVSTLLLGGAPESAGLLLGASVLAALSAILTPVVGGKPMGDGFLFVLDIGWMLGAVLGTGSASGGLALTFPTVAFAAGLRLGGWGAYGLSLAAGCALALGSAVTDGAQAPGWLGLQAALVVAMGAVTDRTRRHLMSRERALAAASRALERMRLDTDSIVQNLATAVVSLDRGGTVVHYNRAAEAILETPGSEVRGRPASVLPEGAAPLLEILEQGLVEGRPATRSETVLELNGRSVPVGLGTTILFGPDREVTGVVGVFQDLTEVREREKEERRRDRLAAVGELAAGIAHEIRNSVLPLSGSVQILAQELQLSPDQARLFEVIEREMESVERFVGDLLRYTRSDMGQRHPVDLEDLAREARSETRLLTRTVIEVPPDASPVWASGDAEQIRQALRNLLNNATDAAGDEGRVAVRCGTEGDTVWIEVDDDGPGLQGKSLDALRVPFFTTKPGGTGLGLAIVSRIIEDHGGSLEVARSRLGGACFRMNIPGAEAPAATSIAA